MERPLGVTLIAVAMMSFSILMVGMVGLGTLMMLVQHPASMMGLPVTLFYLLILAIPGLIGCGLWNMENKARVGCLVLLAFGALAGLALELKAGLFSPVSIIYFPYMIIGGAIAIYLQLPKVEEGFEGEINVINFKEL
jgi:hypothetical protein